MALGVDSIVLDVEVAIVTEAGTDFDALCSGARDPSAILLAFNVLDINGHDLRGLPLVGSFWPPLTHIVGRSWTVAQNALRSRLFTAPCEGMS